MPVCQIRVLVQYLSDTWPLFFDDILLFKKHGWGKVAQYLVRTDSVIYPLPF